jgi:glycosyltransferase involved in cell wall biosynthesis
MADVRVSVVIPSRNERFLVPTVRDLLAHASGPIEVIVVLDGYWPPADQQLPSDPRLRVLHRGEAMGMRAAINAAVEISRGRYILKSDGHCLWPEGYDQVLVEDYCSDDWILVPRRYALDPEAWKIDPSNKKYPIDYHYLSEPFEAHGDSTAGLHGTAWTARRDARKDLLDEEMASQGSAWFISRKCWERLGPQDESLYGKFWFENQEMSLKAWLSGGAQMVTKRTFYAHLYKGRRYGRGYSTRDMGHEAAREFTNWFWMTDQPFQGRTRSFRWLIERFGPVPSWPSDLDAAFARARREFRNPYTAVAA